MVQLSNTRNNIFRGRVCKGPSLLGAKMSQNPGIYNFETGSMTAIPEQLGWESLHKRRKDSKLILLFKG